MLPAAVRAAHLLVVLVAFGCAASSAPKADCHAGTVAVGRVAGGVVCEDFSKINGSITFPSGVELKIYGDKVVVGGKAVDAETKEKIILAVGNVEGVGAVETTDDADTAEAVFHTVVKGDTLSAIAKKTLGNANLYNQIFEANKPMLTHPDKIYPGQVLRIPGGKA